MPIVTLNGWPSGLVPSSPPETLRKLLRADAGMDSDDVEAAVHRLMKAKSVDTFFDLGEDKAARAFLDKVRACGLEGELHDDVPESWFGSLRPRFLICLLAGGLGFLVWLWCSQEWPQAPVTRVLGGILLGYLLSLVFFPRILGKQHMTDEQRVRRGNRRFWVNLALVGAVVLTAEIISEPWIGIVLLALAVCAVVSAWVIREMNRNA